MILRMAIVAALASFFGGIAVAAEWEVVPEASRITWTAKWNTSPVKGGFERFEAEIRFDPDNLEVASVRVAVDAASIYLEGEDARSTLVNENWFDAADHPTVLFVATEFRALDNGRFEALAELTIRGRTQPVRLPFKLTIEDDTAHVEGSLILDRTVFGIGKGGAFADAVAPEVDVAISVTAVRQ